MLKKQRLIALVAIVLLGMLLVADVGQCCICKGIGEYCGYELEGGDCREDAIYNCGGDGKSAKLNYDCQIAYNGAACLRGLGNKVICA